VAEGRSIWASEVAQKECCHDTGRWLALENVASILGWILVLLAIWLLAALLKSVGKKRLEPHSRELRGMSC